MFSVPSAGIQAMIHATREEHLCPALYEAMETWDLMNRTEFKSSGATPFYWSDAVDRVCTPILCLKLATPLGRLCVDTQE